MSWHSLFSLVGMIAGSVLSLRLARYLVKDDRVYPFAIAVVISGLVGARIAHIIDNPAVYGGDLVKMVDLSRGGIGTMGAPIGSTIGGYLACVALRLPKGFMFDVAVVGIALGEAIGRIGDIINGEHHSIACSGLPWCVRYTNPHTLGQATLVHPIGLYDMLFMLGTFIVLYAYWRRVRGHLPESRVYWAYLFLLGAGRFLQGFVRAEPIVAFGWTEAQILSVAYLLAGAAALVWLTSRERRRTSPA